VSLFAFAEGRTAGCEVDVAWASSFNPYGDLRKRLAASPVDAVVAEPAGIATAGLILKGPYPDASVEGKQ
jgi:hypothetical protein